MEPDRLARCRVLLVGSRKHALNTLKSVLGIAGVTNIVPVEDPAHAIDMLAAENFDAVFCDAETEKVGGKSFPKAARANTSVLNPMIPIFEFHGRARHGDVSRSRDSGTTDVMTFPISPRTVVTKLEAALAAPRPFISAPNFFGPDRRAARENFGGHERRVRAPRKVTITKTDTTPV